ncbi:hypothetical protein [Kribbella sp. CA-293567]|uniref:hypothetical protein n=1 Tax=Kribbella sp. CA-293567 TaxID=3002436 RepID=UPI0022DD2514|nr:hypothetical protein [Kribbella sp. CA-293567]WBQ06323.1 hypothetical protein OX958_05900 [Kribbella sp. CA-293567]
MVEEAVTTLRAELGRFGRAEEAFALLETFLEVARPRLESALLDPRVLHLPDLMTDDRAVVQGLIDAIGNEMVPRRRLAVPERAFDLDDPQARWDFTRLAYCSNLATVWNHRRRTTYFEVSTMSRATYWLPESLKTQYFDAIAAKGWAVPAEWLTAVAKTPKPWWRRF